MKECLIETNFGKVKGLENEQGRIFHSIPYAKTERFENPKAVDKWEEFDATGKNKPLDCYQRFTYFDEAHEDNNFYYREFDYYRDSEYVESPMCLSIITPLNKTNCPVLVFFHGGSFENGNFEDEPFGSCYEYAKKGIVLVSVGYRLNVFGLYDSHNFGLKDQLFSIKWVKENIGCFGGDGDHIVIMGQSAGAMSVQNLLYYQPLKELIKGAIMISGAGVLPKFVGPETFENNHEYWQKVMAKAGCENEEQLKKVDAKTLWHAWYETKQVASNFHVVMPSVDKEILTDYPCNLAARNEDIDVPLMVSVTSQDMFPMIIYDWALNCGTRYAKLKSSKVYGYFFDRTLPGNVFKAYHGADLWYLFGFEKCWRPMEEIDAIISGQMITYVANFVKNLDPNSEDLPTWPAISKKNKKFKLFSTSKKVLISPRLCRLKLYKSWLFDKGPF